MRIILCMLFIHYTTYAFQSLPFPSSLKSLHFHQDIPVSPNRGSSRNKHHVLPFDNAELSVLDKLENVLQQQQQQANTNQFSFVEDITNQFSSIWNLEKLDDILILPQITSHVLDNFNDLSELVSKTQAFVQEVTNEHWSYLPMGYNSVTIFLIMASLSAGLIYNLSHPPTNYRDGFEPYDRGDYNSDVARVYYSKHPLIVLRRFLEISRISTSFLIKVFVDTKITKSEMLNRGKRAQELLELIQKTGPTAIKIGQALSVRPDLIAYEYANSLATLQDRVTPFDSKKAKEVVEEELILKGNSGVKSLPEIFTDASCFDNKPVASASIGQVYRVTLRDTNQDVAVKIQRPNVLAEIALDLHIVREFLAPIYKRFTKSGTDYVSLANEWGRGFIAELDYHQEMSNTRKFQNDMKIRKLDDVVTAPTVMEEFCTDRILVTQWIDGKRLDEAEEGSDVTRLCSVALNAYLVMLLETGTLHCDPHPGNLFKDKDGKLVILDFGMTLDTSPTLQYDLLEFIAHLTSGDYDKIPEDLVALQLSLEEQILLLIYV